MSLPEEITDGTGEMLNRAAQDRARYHLDRSAGAKVFKAAKKKRQMARASRKRNRG